MKKLFSLSILLLIFSHLALSHNIDSTRVMKAAENYLNSKQSTLDGTFSIKKVVSLKSSSDTEIGYVIMLKPTGYLIMTNDDNLTPLLAFSFQNEFDFDTSFQNVPLKIILQDLQLRHKAINDNALDEYSIASNISKWNNFEFNNFSSREDDGERCPPYGSTRTGGWVETAWYQSSGYNDKCPLDPITNRRCVTGCVATAIGQIINYWGNLTGQPSTIIFTDSDDYYYSYNPGDGRGTRSQTIDASLANIQNIYYPADPIDLLYACGVSVEMKYTSSGSAAYTYKVAPALKNKFGFVSADYYYVHKNESLFYENLTSNMCGGMPVNLEIHSAHAAHSIVCDGYYSENSTEYFHLNYGWESSDNYDWYQLPQGMPYGYNIVYSGVMNIRNTNLPVCPIPRNVRAINVTESGCELYWDSNDSISQWEIMLDTTGFDTTGVFPESVTTNPHSISGLNPNTSYEYYVRSVCGEGAKSNWIGPYSFITWNPIQPVVLPYYQGWDIPSPGNIYYTNDRIFSDEYSHWYYETEIQREGRIKTGELSSHFKGFSNAGAIYMDKRFTGNSCSNQSILTLDMSNYLNSNSLTMSFWCRINTYGCGYDDEVWIRGSHAEPWIKVANLDPTYTPQIWYKFYVDIDSALANASPAQSLSSTFQVKFKQADTYTFTTIGITYDEIYIYDAGNICGSGLTVYFKDSNGNLMSDGRLYYREHASDWVEAFEIETGLFCIPTEEAVVDLHMNLQNTNDWVYNVSTDNDYTFQTTLVTFELRKRSGELGYNYGEVSYAAGSAIGLTGEDGLGILQKELLPGVCIFRMKFRGGLNDITQDISVNPVVTWQMAKMLVQLNKSDGTRGLNGAEIKYKGYSMEEFGTTGEHENGRARKDLLPGLYKFTIKYLGGKQIVEDFEVLPGENELVIDGVAVTVELLDDFDNPVDRGRAYNMGYTSNMMGFTGDDGPGLASTDLLPLTYDFKMVYDGDRETKEDIDVTVTPWITFYTGDLKSAEVAPEKDIDLVVFPNPFTGNTTIAFSLGQTEEVNVTIYDIRGRKIEVIYDGSLQAGNHKLKWNASVAQKGIYIVRFTSNGNIYYRNVVKM